MKQMRSVMVKLSTNSGYVLRTFRVRYLTADTAYKFYLEIVSK